MTLSSSSCSLLVVEYYSSLRDLLIFMARLGELTQRLVTMTPEGMPERPFFTYDPKQHELRYTLD